jgi:Allene oxide cyclase barrel like domain
MRIKLGMAAVVAAVVAVVGVSLASAQSKGSSDGQVIKLFALTVQTTDLDLGPPGFSLGDQNVFSDDLSPQKGSATTGSDGGVCTIVRIDQQANTAAAQCVVTLSLADGQIAIQGLATFAEEQEPTTFVLPVTGGSGSFSGASGEVSVELISDTEANLTVELNNG